MYLFKSYVLVFTIADSNVLRKLLKPSKTGKFKVFRSVLTKLMNGRLFVSIASTFDDVTFIGGNCWVGIVYWGCCSTIGGLDIGLRLR